MEKTNKQQQILFFLSDEYYLREIYSRKIHLYIQH